MPERVAIPGGSTTWIIGLLIISAEFLSASFVVNVRSSDYRSAESSMTFFVPNLEQNLDLKLGHGRSNCYSLLQCRDYMSILG